MEHQYEYFISEALDLPKDVWHPLRRAGQVRTYQKNKLLYHQGDAANCFYYIVSGRIKSFISSVDGNEHLLTIYKRGDILGEASFFDSGPRVSSAQLMTDATVAAIDRPALEQCLQEYPALAFFFFQYLAATVRMLSTHLDASSFLTADKRIVRLLLNMDTGDNNHTISCTHEELGYMLGLSRVTVSRVLNQLARKRWVALGYRTVILLQPDALRAYLQ